jgi:hypothetical protein
LRLKAQARPSLLVRAHTIVGYENRGFGLHLNVQGEPRSVGVIAGGSPCPHQSRN